MPSLFGPIPDLMSLGKNAPLRISYFEGMRQDLKHHIAVRGPVPESPQSGERKGVGCVVGQVESAFDREIALWVL